MAYNEISTLVHIDSQSRVTNWMCDYVHIFTAYVQVIHLKGEDQSNSCVLSLSHVNVDLYPTIGFNPTVLQIYTCMLCMMVG